MAYPKPTPPPKLKCVGYTPDEHQKAVHSILTKSRCSGRIVVVKSRRQVGKSMMIENELLRVALNSTKTTSISLSPTLTQARKLFTEICEAAPSQIIRSANATLLEINFTNGSHILFKSAEQGDNLRGYTVSGILCIDEAAYISDDVFYLCLPWTDVNKAPILICSTPRVKQGFFYDYYQRGLEGVEGIYSVDWNKFDLTRFLSKERLEQYRKMLPSNQFKSEYLGEWLDADGSVFIGFDKLAKKNSISPSDRLYIGIDWGNGEGDDTVISIVNQHGQQVYLSYWNNLSPTQQINKIIEIITPIENQIVSIEPELNSIGTPYTDMLKTRLRLSTQNKVNGFTTTNSSKAEIVSHLQVAFEQEEIEILDDEKQLRELGYYAAEYNPKTKNVTYNAPQGLHDDICIALMLSWDAYKNNKATGVYAIGNSRMNKLHKG